MQKRARYFIPPITGRIERAEFTDRGLKYIGRDSEGTEISIDVYGTIMEVNAPDQVFVVEGEYLMRDDNDREYVICDRRDRIFMSFKVKDDDTFTIKHGRES